MKQKKKDVWNLIFSAFLVTAFLICSSFFIGMINDSFSQDIVKRTLMVALVFVLFGALLFYATRVGDGRQIVRFSLATLLLMVAPALYVIVASVTAGLPFHDVISSRTELVNIAAVVLGYGLPYTFLSGFELERTVDREDEPDGESDGTESAEPAEETEEMPEDTEALPENFTDESSDGDL